MTQLFTEPYMVQFLLHNALGAWWAGKVLADHPELAQTAAHEDELRRACAPPGYEWTYLRFLRDEEGLPWRPAAGTFERMARARTAKVTSTRPVLRLRSLSGGGLSNPSAHAHGRAEGLSARDAADGRAPRQSLRT